MNLHEWAAKWGVPAAALRELAKCPEPPPALSGKSESAAQAAVRLAASQSGARLWRNNVGVLADERGVPVRYGLANESSQVNKAIKSSDLIGLRPVTVLPEHVGQVIGQFVAREVKRPGWAYSNTARERAQLKFIALVQSLGGDAAFTTGGWTRNSTLKPICQEIRIQTPRTGESPNY